MWADTLHMDDLESDGESAALRSEALNCSDYFLDIRVPSNEWSPNKVGWVLHSVVDGVLRAVAELMDTPCSLCGRVAGSVASLRVHVSKGVPHCGPTSFPALRAW